MAVAIAVSADATCTGFSGCASGAVSFAASARVAADAVAGVVPPVFWSDAAAACAVAGVFSFDASPVLLPARVVSLATLSSSDVPDVVQPLMPRARMIAEPQKS